MFSTTWYVSVSPCEFLSVSCYKNDSWLFAFGPVLLMFMFGTCLNFILMFSVYSNSIFNFMTSTRSFRFNIIIYFKPISDEK